MTNDPTDPGHDVEVLREHVRHLERRVRQLSTPTPETPAELAALPCPFCGHVGLDFADGSTHRWGIASCAGCGATIGETRRKYPDDGSWHADAVKAWNTRATLAASSTAPADARDAYSRIVQHLATVVQLPARTFRGKGEVEFIERERVMGSVVAMRRAADDLIAAAPAAAERKPLTEHQVEEGRVTWLHGPAGMHPSGFHAGARFAERAHGITAAPAGSEGE